MTLPEIEPDPLAARLEQVRWLLAVRRAPEAIPLLHQLIAAYPDEGEPYCFLSCALYTLRKFEEAEQAAQRAVATNPHQEWAHRLRASALSALGKAKLAREAAYTAVQLDPELPHGWRCLADAELALKNLPAAQGAAERARELAPEDADVHSLLGCIATSGRLLPAAETHFRQALKLDPESTYALNGLAATLQSLGRNCESIELYYQGVCRAPGEKWLRQNLLMAIENYIDPPDLAGAMLGCALVLFAPLIVAIQGFQKDQERLRRLNSLPPEIRRFYYEERKRKHKP